MTEEGKYFRDFEEIRNRPGFDISCGISPENYGGLVGEYHFAGDTEVRCQREQPNGSLCGEGHKNGWLGRRSTDGKEALIGQNCGIKYFKASAQFVADRRRLTRDLNIASYLRRLDATAKSDTYKAEHARAIGRLRYVRESVAQFRERLPSAIVQRLERMAKARDGAVGVVFRYEDEDEDGTPTVQWVPDRIGTVAGIELWDSTTFQLSFKALHEIRDAFTECDARAEAGERKLRLWAEKLDELPIWLTRLTELESAWEGFVTRDNLMLLCFLVPNQDDGRAAAGLALEFEKGEHVTPAAARQQYQELCAQIGARANDRPFRVDL